MKIVFILIFDFMVISCFCLFQDQDPDQFRDATQIIKSRGFGVEEHTVITPDGYILALQHIINPYVPRHRVKKSLLLVHGILASSTDWLMNSPGVLTSDGNFVEDKYYLPVAYRELNGQMVPIGGSTAFVLSQFGYDVWLGNTRGTVYSMNHTFLNSKTDPRYWMFSLDEIALKDIPSMIQYVLKTTKRNKVGYICHSQGCGVMFALLSAKPQYSNVISEFIGLSPAVFLTNTYGLPTRALYPTHPLFRSVSLGVLTPIPIQLKLQGMLCRDKSLRYVCGVLLGLITGLNPHRIAYERIAAFAAHFPTGVSTWVLAHFLQWSGTGRFARFDYGIRQNLIKYGQTYPPEYPLRRIKLKTISIFYTLNDAIVEYRNVLMIKHYLKVPLYSENLVRDPKWGHYDYFSAKTVGFNINSKIIDLLLSTERV